MNLDNFESREVWLQSRVKHRVPETRDQRYERVKKEREARGKQVGLKPSLFIQCVSVLQLSCMTRFSAANRGERSFLQAF